MNVAKPKKPKDDSNQVQQVALAEAADAWSRTTHGTDAETDAAIPLLWHTAKVTGALDEAAAEARK